MADVLQWIELDLFHDGLARFSEAEFLEAGLNAEYMSLIQFMADQETGHSTLLTNMLGERAPVQCYYDYPYNTVREWLDFMQRVTRFGESGVWGFINHLDSREVGQLLAQSIATEARQQQIFRQMSGLTPMNVWFENGWPYVFHDKLSIHYSRRLILDSQSVMGVVDARSIYQLLPREHYASRVAELSRASHSE